MSYHDYVELNVMIPSVDDEKREIVIALLSGAGFESFADTPSGINAYIPSESFSIDLVNDCHLQHLKDLAGIAFSHRVIKRVNWNKQWESNFSPVIVAGRCSVRASFHPEPEDIEYDIIIDPKMSFGTGHHNTTALMAELLLDLPVAGKKVLDMGCGTGILAILAAKKNAEEVTAVDIDEWAYRNTVENCIVNGVDVFTQHGDIGKIKGRVFDVVMANITRNVLVDNMHLLCASLNSNGFLLLSGFMSEDIDDMDTATGREGLRKIRILEREGWCSAEYFKP